jgi:hypothetical protein
MVLLGWFLNTFEIVFTQNIQQMDSHNYFNFVIILHKVRFHVELHISLGSPPFNHNQAFKWSSFHYHKGKVVLIHKSHFMPLILRCFCNTFIFTLIWSNNQGWMWSSNLWHQMHLGWRAPKLLVRLKMNLNGSNIGIIWSSGHAPNSQH